MGIISNMVELERKYNVRLSQGENFKQAIYNKRMTDSKECVIDKIELIIKHYPDCTNIHLSTYEYERYDGQNMIHAVAIPNE